MRLSLWVDKACQGRDCWKTRWRQAEDGPWLSLRSLVFAGHHCVTGIKVQHQGPCHTDLPWGLQTRLAGVERQEVSDSYPMWCVLWLGCLPRLQGRGCGLQFTLKCCRIIGGLQRNDCDPPVTKQSWFFLIILASVLVMSFSLPKCPSLDSKLCAHIVWLQSFSSLKSHCSVLAVSILSLPVVEPAVVSPEACLSH